MEFRHGDRALEWQARLRDFLEQKVIPREAEYRAQVAADPSRQAPVMETMKAAARAEGLLLASATTEIGIGGDVRSSTCFVDREGDRARVAKNAPVISYGEHADLILVTARRDADSAPVAANTATPA